ncbi:hypothetical protein IFM89_013932 [Coptis chinensis]|uniref:DNA-(apurinic or apyrimidinic site) endonuclease n=1 Tax=Coptis chinensis TaxID=261450 RepID=A0A835HEB6_9MAGN|nr:hypothetical protein IFM89_013932 [Coptis chinensis]
MHSKSTGICRYSKCRHFYQVAPAPLYTGQAAVAPRNLRLKARIIMGSELFLSSNSNKKRAFKEEEEFETSSKVVKIETCGQDLQAMTVQQLRTMSNIISKYSEEFRDLGRGSKHDLVSALKCFLDNEKDVNEDTQSKSKTKNLTSGEKAQKTELAAEVSGFQQKKRRGKPPIDDDDSLVVKSESLIIKERVSLKRTRVSDKKPSPTKGKGVTQIEIDDGGFTDGVGLLKNSEEPWTKLAHKKPQEGWIPYNPRTMRPPPLDDCTNFVKLISWNVNGLRALLKLDTLSAFALRENFDILCLQETKLQASEKDVEKIKERLIDGYENSFWTCSVSKLGYSGTAIISRIKPLSVRYGLGILDHDSEGRLVTLEFDTFYLISGYVPNSGDGLRRLTYRVTQWDPSLSNYMKELEKSKPVILTGDLNCAHQEIDIFNPSGNKRSAGFTIEERESFEMNFLSKGFVDTFRRQHPGVVGYTYWGFRHGGRVDNKGWRLDYFLVSESIADLVHDSYIMPHITGSDHCPIGLILKL